MATLASLPQAFRTATPAGFGAASANKHQSLTNHAPRTHRGAFSFARFCEGVEAESGDLGEVVRVGAGRVAVLVADVAGHGAEAAVIARQVRDLWRAALRSPLFLKPATILAALNRALCACEALDSRFVAATCAIVDTRRGVATLARAGAPYPIIRRFDGERHLLRPRGTALGVDPAAVFETLRLTLDAGDALYLMSDGVEPLLTAQAEGQLLPDGRIERTLAPDELVANSRWFKHLARNDAHAALSGLAKRRQACLAAKLPIDDVTAVAIQAH